MESPPPEDQRQRPRDPGPPPSGEEPTTSEGGFDLLTIGLLVFFVSLIAIVGAMLLLTVFV